MGEEPKLVSRRDHKKSTFMLGRTIGAKREHLETRNERAAARKKDKQKKATRIIFSTIGLLLLIVVLVLLIRNFVSEKREEPISEVNTITSYEPSINIIDESASATGGKITNRMKEYIAQLEISFRELHYTPSKAVIPASSIREIDFYLEDHNGYIKTITDRGAGVTAEDADRMIRYLTEQGITDYEYIDVRTEGRAFWH
ncbi:hypothetical protein IKG38_02575 [Candidatus Saccharibacteria bacterium]|nr:hypothetical protein [Candidatus Saccharibacteria bacterium]